MMSSILLVHPSHGILVVAGFMAAPSSGITIIDSQVMLVASINLPFDVK